MDVGGTYMITTFLVILDIPGVNSNIGNHVIKVMENKIGPTIRYMDYKYINQNEAD